jgi:hypothetical protein
MVQERVHGCSATHGCGGGVAVQLDFCEDGFIGQQPMEGAGQMLLVAFGAVRLRLVARFRFARRFDWYSRDMDQIPC